MRIIDSDPEGARECVREHLEEQKRNLLESLRDTGTESGIGRESAMAGINPEKGRERR